MVHPLAIVSSHLPSSGISELFESARRCGFEIIEWMDPDGTFSCPETGRKIRELSRSFRIGASYHAPFLGRWSLGTCPQEGVGPVFEEILSRAELLGACGISLHLGARREPEGSGEALRRIAGMMDSFHGRLEGSGLAVCVENVTTCFNERELGVSTEDFEVFFDALSTPLVGMTLDVGHANITANLGELVRRFGRKLWNVHLYDTDGFMDRHLPPGQGTLDWEKVFSLLADAGYPGPLTFEFTDTPQGYGRLAEKIRAFQR